MASPISLVYVLQRDIARESGASIGSIYHHFKDKEGVASAMYNSLLDRMHSELAEIQANHDPK